MALLKALLATIGLFGVAIFITWLGHQEVIGTIAVLAIVFIAITYCFYDVFKSIK